MNYGLIRFMKMKRPPKVMSMGVEFVLGIYSPAFRTFTLYSLWHPQNNAVHYFGSALLNSPEYGFHTIRLVQFMWYILTHNYPYSHDYPINRTITP